MLDYEAVVSTFIKHIIIGDETLINECEIKTIQQSRKWSSKNEPKPKNPCQSHLKIKGMLIRQNSIKLEFAQTKPILKVIIKTCIKMRKKICLLSVLLIFDCYYYYNTSHKHF